MSTEHSNPRPAGRTLNRSARVAISLALVLAGAVALWLIYSTEPVAERETQVRQSAMLVEVTQPETGHFRPVIETLGTVTPARSITLTTRVDGEVIALEDALDPGSFVQQGQALAKIDDADYRNILAQREAEVLQAEAEVEIEKGRRLKAELDFQSLGKEVPEDRRSLILREPQRRSAEAMVQAARAAVEQARLDLERTAIKAPFDAQVLAREVDIGSQVSVGQPLARLAGVGTYWIETTIPLDKLRWLGFSQQGDEGSQATVRHRSAWPDGQSRSGSLYRLIGEVEGETRLARALIAVDDPLALEDGAEGLPRLMIGTYVECHIEGREIPNGLRLPRELIRKGDTVWLMREGLLAVQPVDVAFQDAEYAYIDSGLRPDDQVITTSLATVKEGVPLRLEPGE